MHTSPAAEVRSFIVEQQVSRDVDAVASPPARHACTFGAVVGGLVLVFLVALGVFWLNESGSNHVKTNTLAFMGLPTRQWQVSAPAYVRFQSAQQALVSNPPTQAIVGHRRIARMFSTPETQVLCQVPQRCPPPKAIVQDIPLAVQHMTHTSGMDEMPFVIQQAAFLGTFVALIACAVSIDKVYKTVQRARPMWWWGAWEIGAAFLLGAIFVTAGRSHFTAPEAFMSIYPPWGTWGFWYLPGSAQFHVAWTGVAELCGGSGLLLGGFIDALALANVIPAQLSYTIAPSGKSQLLPYSARLLFLLVLSVTPANFLMFSHGATMPGIVDGPLSMSWHLARFVAQVSLLSVLLSLSGQGAQDENLEDPMLT